ncbi:MAG: Xanthomonas phage [Verrucomicrobiota bacterium]|jgi:hypothetical protein
MPIASTEIQPGAVAYFDVACLLGASGVRCTAAPGVLRNGPFLCVDIKGDKSLWLQIIGSAGKEKHRYEIAAEARSGGSDSWRQRPQYLHDPRHPVIASSEAVVAATAEELPMPSGRPGVDSALLPAIIAEIRKVRGAAL